MNIADEICSQVNNRNDWVWKWYGIVENYRLQYQVLHLAHILP